MFAGIIILSKMLVDGLQLEMLQQLCLWIGGQVSAENIIVSLIVPSIVCTLVPLIYLSFRLKGSVKRPELSENNEEEKVRTSSFEKNLIFYLGVLGLLFVPVFKTITNLPPYLGMILSLGVLWTITEIIHRNKTKKKNQNYL